MSRTKGARVERQLKEFLNKRGLEALRVPLSGAQQGYKGDVIAKDTSGKEHLFEVKARKDKFNRLYKVLLPILEATPSKNTFIDLGGAGYVNISLNFPMPHGGLVLTLKPQQTQMIVNLQKLLGEAEYLVLKGNNNPFLFLQYEKKV